MEKTLKNDKLPRIVKKDSFWWRDVLKLLPQFKEMASIELSNGTTYFFYKDTWESQALEIQFLQAYFLREIKILQFKKLLVTITVMFTLPLSQVAFEQLA